MFTTLKSSQCDYSLRLQIFLLHKKETGISIKKTDAHKIIRNPQQQSENVGVEYHKSCTLNAAQNEIKTQTRHKKTTLNVMFCSHY